MKKNEENNYKTVTWIQYYRKKIRPFIKDHSTILFASMWVIAFLLGFIGYRESYAKIGENKQIIDIIYTTMQLFLINYKLTVSPPVFSLQVARFLAPCLMFSAVILLLIKNFHENIKVFMIKYLFRKHVIVCGMNLLGPILAENFSREGKNVVVIGKNPTDEEIERWEDEGAIVIKGEAKEERTLVRAGLTHSSLLLAATNNDGENAEIAMKAREVHERTNTSFTCIVHVVDTKLAPLLRAKQTGIAIENHFKIEFFNIFDRAGDIVLRNNKIIDTIALNYPKNRFLVIGVGRMGESVLIKAAKRWRSLNRGKKEKLSVTIIDRKASEKRGLFLMKYPSLDKYADIEALSYEIHSKEFLEAGFLFRGGKCDIASMLICFEDENLNLYTALELNEKINTYFRTIKSPIPSIPIIIRTRDTTGINRYLSNLAPDSNDLKNLKSFALIDETCRCREIENGLYEQIARAVHKNYLKMMDDENGFGGGIENFVPWEKLSKEIQDSNLQQAEGIASKINKVGCTIIPENDWDAPLFTFTEEELSILANFEHTRWMQEKIEKGWKYGSIRDNQKKLHPCIVSWEELSQEERDKDFHAVKNIPDILQEAGLTIAR